MGVFFGIILTRKSGIGRLIFGIWNVLHLHPWRFVNPKKAPLSRIGNIFQDFFFLNSNLLNGWSSLENGLGLIAKTGMAMAGNGTNSTQTPNSPKTKATSSAASLNKTPAAEIPNA